MDLLLAASQKETDLNSGLSVTLVSPKPKEQGRTPHAHSMDVRYLLTFPSVGNLEAHLEAQTGRRQLPLPDSSLSGSPRTTCPLDFGRELIRDHLPGQRK